LVKTVKIFGKLWKFRRGRVRECYGVAHGVESGAPVASPSDMTNREIVIDPGLTGEKELEIILHEVLHAADWHRSEEWVAQISRDTARILTRLGYRKEAESSG